MKVATICGLGLAGLFLFSAVAKLTSFNSFLDYFGAVAPSVSYARRWVGVVGLAVICLEVGLASWIVLGPAPIALFASSSFLAIATAFLGSQHVSRRTNRCRCFGNWRSVAPRGSKSILESEAPAESLKRILVPAHEGVRNTLFATLGGIGVAGHGVPLGLSVMTALAPGLVMIAAITIAIGVEHGKLRLTRHPRYGYFAPILAPLTVLPFYSKGASINGAS